MLQNYLKWIFRSLKFNKLYAIINVVGLTIGFASAFFIMIYIFNETSYDKHQNEKDKIYRFIQHDGMFKMTSPNVCYNLDEKIGDQIPEFEFISAARRLRSFSVQKDGEIIRERNVLCVQKDFLNIFTLDFIYGSAENSLNKKDEIIITESISKKYFNDENPLNQNLTVNIYGKEIIMKITGVVKDYPKLSTVKFKFLVDYSYETEHLKPIFGHLGTSLDGFFNYYVKVNKTIDMSEMEAKFNEISKLYNSEDRIITLSLQPMGEFYLGSEGIVNNGLPTGNKNNVILFSAVACIVLVIAIFNYIILSFAKYLTRTKEFGLRKITGASKRHIRTQVIGETLCVVFGASIFGILIVETSKEYVQQFFQINLNYSLKSTLTYYFSFLAISTFITLIAGYILSRKYIKINPILSLKNTFSPNHNNSSLRSILITIQLIVFSGLLLATLVVKKQITYFINYTPGYDNNNLLTLYLNEELSSKYYAFKDELKNHSAVQKISGAFFLPPAGSSMSNSLTSPDDPEIKVVVEAMSVDHNFINTLGIKLAQGRDFNPNLQTDSSEAILLNESAVEALGLKDPVGKQLEYFEIIGVVKDFNLHSLHNEIPPIMMDICPIEYMEEIIIKYDPNNLEPLIEYIENKWIEFAPDTKPQYHYYEDLNKSQYEEEKQLGNILTFFTSGAILIAMLGLFGLAMFIMEKRTKEIGIRKVHGASIRDILQMISRDFSILLIPAWLIAFPFTWYFMNKWLQKFAYQTSIDWWVFLISALCGFIILQLVIGLKTFQSARTNPVETLRYE